MNRTLRSLGYALAALGAATLTPAAADGPAPETDPLALMAPYAALLNDMSARRRRVIYTPLPVSPKLGVLRSMVHTTDGSAAFARTDLVTVAPIPIVITRAYHSGRRDADDFGNGGWTLTLAERITRNKDGSLAYRFGNGRTLRFGADGDAADPADRFLSDVTDFLVRDDASIEVRTRTGIRKHFEGHRDHFRLKKVENDLGNSVTLGYEADALSRIDAGQGVWVTIRRDARHRIESVSDSTGRTVRYAYDDNGRLAEVTDLRGETWQYRYGPAGRLEAAMTPAETTDLAFTHDKEGRVRSASIHGATESFDYDGRKTTVVDAAGFETEYHASYGGLTVGVRNALGVTTRVELDPVGRPHGLWRKQRKVAELQFDGPGTNSLERLDVQPHRASETYSYDFDSAGRITRLSSDSGGPVFEITGYGQGLTPTRVRYGDGAYAGAAFARSGSLARFRYRDGRSYLISDGERQWTVVASPGRRAHFRFDDAGRLIAVTAPDRRTAVYEYDAAGLRERTRFPSGSVFEYLYDPSGSLFQSTIDVGATQPLRYSYTYEIGPDQRVDRIVDSHAPPHSFGYADNGLPLSVRSTLLPNANFRYDGLGRLTGVSSDRHDPITYRYQDGEPDVVAQLDTRTLAAFNQQRDRATFGTRFETLYARTRVSDLGLFAYDELIHEIVVSTPPQNWSPTLPIERTLEAMRLPSLFSGDAPDLEAFSMPSNRFFVPPEFWAVNCCFCYGCPGGTQSCDEP